MGILKVKKTGTSLVVQWLGLWAPNAEDPGPIPGQETGSHMLQLKILHAAAKLKDPTCHNCRTPCSQIRTNIYIKTTHGQIPFSLLKGLIREENLRRKHCRGCEANVNSNSQGWRVRWFFFKN